MGVALFTAFTPPPGEFRDWPHGGPGRTPRRTHRGRSAGDKDACGRCSVRGDRFLPRPTRHAAAAAATAAAVAARQLPRLRNRRRRWRQLHFRSGHHFRSRPRPAPAPAPSPHWTSGARGCLGRPRGARQREKEAERRSVKLQRAEGGGPRPEGLVPERVEGGRKWGWESGKRRWRSGGSGGRGGGSRTGMCGKKEDWASFEVGRA